MVSIEGIFEIITKPNSDRTLSLDRDVDVPSLRASVVNAISSLMGSAPPPVSGYESEADEEERTLALSMTEHGGLDPKLTDLLVAVKETKGGSEVIRPMSTIVVTPMTISGIDAAEEETIIDRAQLSRLNDHGQKLCSHATTIAGESGVQAVGVAEDTYIDKFRTTPLDLI